MNKIISSSTLRNALIIASLLFTTAYASAQVQTVTGALSVSEISGGQSTTLTATYKATGVDADGNPVDDALVTGLGLRLHYDSSLLQIGEVVDLLREGKQGDQVKSDTEDFDNDTSTDKFFLATWADTSAEWPYGEVQPVTLYSVPFTALSGFQTTTLKFTQSSGAAGYSFDAADVGVVKIPGTVSTLSDLTASYPAFVTAAPAINIPVN